MGPYQRDYERKLNIGIIGAGSHCYRNILPVMNYLPVTIKAICDVNQLVAEKTAMQYNSHWYTRTSEMYSKENLDAVFISVGPSLHSALVIEALDNGMNVWVEKPIATRSSQVLEMISHRKDATVVVGLKKAFSPACIKIDEICKSPSYGSLQSILAVYPMSIESNGEDILAANDAPNWLRNGVHPLSFMMQIGGKVRSVTSITNEKGYGNVVLEFANGCMGTLHLASGPKPDFETYDFYGDNWKAHVEDSIIELDRGIEFNYGVTTTYAPSGFDNGKIVWAPSDCVATLENKALFKQGFYNETWYFCDCVLNNKKPERGTLEFAFEVMKVYEAAFMSHGKPVAIEG